MEVETKAIKYSPRSQKLGKNPVFVVGLAPGRQRYHSRTLQVWEGNRSGDFVKETLADAKNVYFTNLCNYYLTADLNEKVDVKYFEEGFEDLKKAVEKYQPRKIVCLGQPVSEFAMKHFKNVVSLPHPSYILRFNKDVTAFKRKLRREVMGK